MQMNIAKMILCLVLLSLFVSGCEAPRTSRLTREEYKGRIEEIRVNRVTIISCIRCALERKDIFGFESLSTKYDTLLPITDAEETISGWLCRNGKGYTDCANPKQPPQELDELHNTLCQSMEHMKECLHSVKDQLTKLWVGSAMHDNQRYSESVLQFEIAADTFETTLAKLEDALAISLP